MDKIARIKELVSQLNQYRNSYYNENNSLVSDAEYDKMFDELQQLEVESGFILSNSPTKSVGYEVKSKLNKVQHPIPLLSLDKTKSVDDIKKFIGNKSILFQLKFDGLTCELIYENGNLIQASTRGDGYEGEDITHNARTFANLPLKINRTGHIKIVGEALIKYNDFKRINESLPADNQYKTLRNLASGSVRQLDNKECSQRHVYFYPFDILEGRDDIYSRYQNLKYLQELGFGYVETIWSSETKSSQLDAEKINGCLENLRELAAQCYIPIDGIVVRYDDVAYGKSLGSTSHHNNDGLAFKFEDETATTILREVEWSIGRSGRLTPVALFDTVELDGTEVSRSSLHNISIIEKLKLGLLDEVNIAKMNMIIPQIVSNNTQSNTLKIPTKCPFCSHLTEVIQENESKVLMCTNESCSGRLLSKFSHFVSKPAMNIDGLSEATLEKFINKGWLKTFSDIYKLNEHRCDIENMQGFGKKSYEKMWNAIEESKNVNLANYLVALGISNIGRTASKVISRQFKGDWGAFAKAVIDKYDFSNLEDFGPTMNDSIHNYFNSDDNANIWMNLSKYMNFEKQSGNDIDVGSKINELTFVITGSVTHYKNRDELKAHIESLGGKVSGSVSAKTDYLINNDVTSTSGKNKKANELGVKIISEYDFIKMIGG